MADEPESIGKRLKIHLEPLSAEDKISLIGEIYNTLSVHDLITVRFLAEDKRLEKLEAAKHALIEELKRKCEELGLPVSEIMGGSYRRTRRDSGRPLPVKYRGPDGQTWSGRGTVPNWLRELEEKGHDRDEFRVDEQEAGREGQKRRVRLFESMKR